MGPKRRRIESGKTLVFSVSEWQNCSRQFACHPEPFARFFVCAYAALHRVLSYAMTYSHKPQSILPRGAGLKHSRCEKSISRFQFSAFWSNGLASSVFIFAPILLRFFFILSVYAWAKIICYRFFNFDMRKKLCFLKADRVA